MIVITFLKILLTVILIPLKIVFIIVAYSLALVIFIITLPIRLVNDLLEFMHTFFTPILVISAIGVDIFIINRIISEVTPLSEGIFLIIGITLTSAILLVLFNTLDTILETIDSLLSTLICLATANWFKFW